MHLSLTHHSCNTHGTRQRLPIEPYVLPTTPLYVSVHTHRMTYSNRGIPTRGMLLPFTLHVAACTTATGARDDSTQCP